MAEIQSKQDDRRETLKADCAKCVGLCCVALAFAKSADFAFDKAAGEPCTNLQDDHRCGIHPQLRERGFKGCTVFDCFGAGQKVTQVTFNGQSWSGAPDSGQLMFAVFPVMRQLHELLWYLNEAIAMPQSRPMRVELDRAYAETEDLTEKSPDEIILIEVGAHRDRMNVLLSRVSELVRASAQGREKASKGSSKIRPGADLIGAKLAGQNLQGSNLRGAYLIAADLHRADLRGADLIGADLRDADLSGADVSESLFLTQSQLNEAQGDAATKLPPSLSPPTHWAR